MLAEIENKVKIAKKMLESINYFVGELSAKEFFDYMSGETFSGDTITLEEVLGNDYLLIHEVVEVNELKKMGRTIDTRVIVDSPKSIIYAAHFRALEKELEYALRMKDYAWVKSRIGLQKIVLENDPHLPEEMKPKAKAILEKFIRAVRDENHLWIQ
jgi:hypothetical protein